MNKIDHQKFTANASSFLDELFRDHDNNSFDLPDSKVKLRKTKESPRVYRFNP
jgi:hypothetical protein